MRRLIGVLASAVLWGVSAQAEPYWIAYEASDGLFPEDEEVGWDRHMHDGGAVRSVSDGILTLDSLSSSTICDFYLLSGR